MLRKIIPDVICDQKPVQLAGGASVHEAAKSMRQRNVGWRLDYVLASPSAMRYVRHAFHQPEVMGSDHCPVGVDLDPRILG